MRSGEDELRVYDGRGAQQIVGELQRLLLLLLLLFLLLLLLLLQVLDRRLCLRERGRRWAGVAGAWPGSG